MTGNGNGSGEGMKRTRRAVRRRASDVPQRPPEPEARARPPKPRPRTEGGTAIVPRAEVDAHSHALYERFAKTTPRGPVIGGLEIARLMDVRQFVFRQKMYRVPPVEADLAAQILDCQERIRRHAKPGTTVEEVREMFRDAARLSKQAARPAGWFRRWFLPGMFWGLWRNPFRKATPGEVGRNLAFFSTLIVSEVRLPSAEPRALRPGTSSPTSQDSPKRSRPGAIRRGGRSGDGGGSRSPGATS